MGKLHDFIKLNRGFQGYFRLSWNVIWIWIFTLMMLHSLLHSSNEIERTVPRQRSHQLWPTKYCRVVRKYWARTRHWLVRSLAPRDLLQCSACDCVAGVSLGTESLVIRDSVQTLCAVLDRDHVTPHFLSTRPWPPVGINIDFELFYEARESSVGTGSLIIFSGIYTQTQLT